MNKLWLFLCILPAVLGAHVDLSTYPLSQVLRDEGGETYTLYWAFDVEEETIRFAVRVSTLGWVGFGLSPTGGMANSDVVIGWVNDNGQAFLDDRFATGRSRPPVDAQQDWFLDGGEEDNGYTILAFSRDWVTCDEKDREIMTDTTRVIFSWNEADPANDDRDLVLQHSGSNRGSASVNLLGGQQEVPPDPADLQSFDVTVDAITVPGERDTTYWCYAAEIPASIQAQTHYVTKVTPVITAGNELNVHHILIYECDALNDTHVGFSGRCNTGGEVGSMVSQCRGGTLLTGWAIGGTEFAYPENVAYPIGGAGAPRYIVMEVHYDNPPLESGETPPDIVDSSGMRFSYTATPRTYDAGVLQVGHFVTRYMVVPPGSPNFLMFGECGSECTSTWIPEGGINVFANTLHTHLAGISLTVQHLRQTTCGLEELKPIDQNLQYDFNYQQANYLPQIVNVQPGDIIRLQCTYNTENAPGVVLGGESTNEEMCLTFLNYYPRVDLSACLTYTPLSNTAFQPFLIDHLTPSQLNNLSATIFNNDREGFESVLNSVTWSDEAIESLQTSIDNGPRTDGCIALTAYTEEAYDTGLPAIDCAYEAPDPCSPGDGAPPFSASISVVFAVALVVLAMLK